MSHCVGYSLACAAITIGVSVGLIKIVGFPLPFSTLTVSPFWLALTSTAMTIQWTKPIRKIPATAKMVIDMIKLWLCDTLLAFIYPVYFYVFTTLSAQGQTAFSILLPVIKLFMRYLFAQMARHHSDETPEIVVFNAELFNSLFVSYCMQKSPSFTTTALMTIANIVTMALSLRDIEKARRGFRAIEERIDKERSWSSFRGHISYNTTGGRPLTTLERASSLLQLDANQVRTQVATNTDVIRISSLNDEMMKKMKSTRMIDGASITVMPKKLFSSSSHPIRFLSRSRDSVIIHPTVEESEPDQSDLPHL